MRFRNWSLQIKILAVVCGPLALFVGLGLVAQRSVEALRDNVSEVVTHSGEVHEGHRSIQRADELDRLLAVTESAERAFLVTGQEAFHKAYADSAARFLEQLSAIRGRVDAAQQRRLTDVEAYFQQWQKEAAGPEIAARRQVDARAAERAKAMARFKEEAHKVKVAELIPPETLARFQDIFTRSTGIANLVVEVDGKPVKGQTFDGFTSFCFGGAGKSIRKSKAGGSRCEECDARGGKAAAESGRPSVYDCHAGLVDFGVPIMLKGKQIGSWLGGQVLTTPPDLERYRAYAQELGDVEPEALVEAVKQVPVVPRARIDAAADMLWLFAATTAEMGDEKRILAFSKAGIEEDNQLRTRVTELLASGKGAAILAKARVELAELIKAQEAHLTGKLGEMKVASDTSSKTAKEALRLLMVGTGAVALLGLLFALGVIRLIVSPIHAAVRMAHALTEGRLEERLKVRSKDEVGRLSAALNEMADELANKQRSLERSLKTVTDMVSEVTRISTQVDARTDQLSMASESLSQGATEQAAGVEQISCNLSEINDQTRVNSETAQEAMRLAEGAREGVEQGNERVREMVTAMEEISESSSQISQIVEVIDNIAAQTNFLALNAAVEAARAGEQGRSFAVVADEVRSLANRSTKAARETNALLTASIERIEAGTKIADDTATVFARILDDIRQIHELVRAIADASASQAGGMNEIDEALRQIGGVVHEGAAQANETAVVASELAEQVISLRKALSVNEGDA